MIRGAIFDADGTLLNSMSIWDTLPGDYLRSLGIEPRENLAETFRTFSTEQSARYYQDVYGVDRTVSEIQDGLNRMIEDFYLYRAPLKPGAETFLRELQKKGVPMCIATATDRHLIDRALARCGVRGCFCGIVTCADVGQSKSDPAVYRAALDLLGTNKAETWVFEDALHAAQTAKRDSFPVAAVSDPSEPGQDALRALSDRYLSSFSPEQTFSLLH